MIGGEVDEVKFVIEAVQVVEVDVDGWNSG